MENQQARPKRWLLIPLALLPLICFIWLSYFFSTSPVTTILIVRHAEKNIEPNNPNPSLSAEGIARSQTLRHVLGESNVKTIYTSQFLRTQQTAQPLAERLGLNATQIDAKDTRAASSTESSRIIAAKSSLSSDTRTASRRSSKHWAAARFQRFPKRSTTIFSSSLSKDMVLRRSSN